VQSNSSVEIDELKIIYKEVIDGFAYNEESNCYIKHLTELENGELTRIRSSIFLKFKKDGLPSEEDKLKQIIDSGIWPKEKEEAILDQKYFISDNEKNLKNIIPQQHGPILNLIEDAKKKLNALLIERSEHIGVTANEYSEREGIHALICMSFYKDKGLQEKMFPDGLDDLENNEIDPYIDAFSQTSKRYNENTIKKVAVLPFFLNPFSYCKEAIHTFLGKPIVQLTPYQLLLFSMGSRNLNILSQSDGEPPELHDDVKLQQIIDWYDLQYSILLGKRKSGK